MEKNFCKYSISFYNPQDCQEVSALLEANHKRVGGVLSSDYSPESIQKLAELANIIVAKDQEKVVGVLVTLEKKYANLKPLWVSVLEVWPGSPDAYLYGPICVAEEYKGQGLILHLWNFLQAHTQGREAILSICESNTASLRAHQRLGMRQVARLEDSQGTKRLIFSSH